MLFKVHLSVALFALLAVAVAKAENAQNCNCDELAEVTQLDLHTVYRNLIANIKSVCSENEKSDLFDFMLQSFEKLQAKWENPCVGKYEIAPFKKDCESLANSASVFIGSLNKTASDIEQTCRCGCPVPEDQESAVRALVNLVKELMKHH